MKNVLICKNCETENAIYKLTCSNCKEYMRERIVNLDLWSTIWKLVESPTIGFSNIIHSEHKNFIIVLTFLFSIKYFINTLIFTNAFEINTFTLDYLLQNFALSLLYTILLICLFSLLITLLNKLFGIKSRFKDNIAIYVYSTFPLILAGLFLFLIEFALFGHYFLSFDPSPFLLKKNVAYISAGLEAIIVIWSLVLSIAATFAQSKSIIYSIAVGTIYIGLLFYCMIYLPYFPF